jgi:hypothetical protein
MAVSVLSASSIRGVHVVLLGIDEFCKKKNERSKGRAFLMGIIEIVFTRVPWKRMLLFWKKTSQCKVCMLRHRHTVCSIAVFRDFVALSKILTDLYKQLLRISAIIHPGFRFCSL